MFKIVNYKERGGEVSATHYFDTEETALMMLPFINGIGYKELFNNKDELIYIFANGIIEKIIISDTVN